MKGTQIKNSIVFTPHDYVVIAEGMIQTGDRWYKLLGYLLHNADESKTLQLAEIFIEDFNKFIAIVNTQNNESGEGI